MWTIATRWLRCVCCEDENTHTLVLMFLDLLQRQNAAPAEAAVAPPVRAQHPVQPAEKAPPAAAAGPTIIADDSVEFEKCAFCQQHD